MKLESKIRSWKVAALVSLWPNFGVVFPPNLMEWFYIPFHKKGDLKKCGNFRGSSQICYKIYVNMIKNRLYYEDKLSETDLKEGTHVVTIFFSQDFNRKAWRIYFWSSCIFYWSGEILWKSYEKKFLEMLGGDRRPTCARCLTLS